MSEELTIAISTCNDRIFAALDLVANTDFAAQFLIVHQTSVDAYDEEIQARLTALNAKKIQYLSSNSYGLARSRNLALELCNTPFLLLADDDIGFTKELDAALQLLKSHDFAAATYVCLNEKNKARKNYRDKAFVHNRISVLKTGSVEIMINVARARKCYAAFPINMGVGTELPACEETVFLSRLMSGGEKVGFFPVPIVTHPDESSGASLNDKGQIMARGVLFKESFGYIVGSILLAAFLLKSFLKSRTQGGALGFIRALYHAYTGFFLLQAR